MSPLNDAVMSNPSAVQISTPSSPPESSVSSKLAADVSGTDSDCKNRSEGINQPLEKAANLITNVKTLTKLCDLDGADAVKIGDTLIKHYTDICNQQAYRTTAREITHSNLLATMKQESILDENVAAHYDRFVCKMEEAKTAMSEQHKQVMMMDAMKSIRLARENSQLARNIRNKIDNTKAKLRLTDREMMAARDKLVDLLYSAVLYCLEPDTGAVEAEKSEINQAG